MKQSSASFISYDLRPSKQAERRIILDFLKCASEIGMPLSGYRYVGMGGTMFYDFHLIHRFLGIDRMVSLERNPELHPRSVFNCPFDFINVKNETVAAFLAEDRESDNTVYWFDYDDSLDTEITNDITSLGTHLKVGDFAFVTVCGEPPRVLEKQSEQERLEFFERTMEDFSIGLARDDMSLDRFPATVDHILELAFQNAFAHRTDGNFAILFRIRYKDSKWMVTVGGALCAPNRAKDLSVSVRKGLPFLLKRPPYRIRSFNLTEKERVLFDVAVTKRRSTSKQTNSLKKLGFKKRDFEAYGELLRFLPRYHESII